MSGRHARVSRAPWVAGILAGGTVLGLSAALVIAGVQGVGPVAAAHISGAGELQQPVADSTGSGGPLQDPIATTDAPPRAGIVATHLDIPAIGVSTDLESLAVDSSGVLHPPIDFDRAGWFSGGVLPGRIGPAVIAGHLDSVVRPAVFEHLPELVPGDAISVGLSDGTSVSFVVSSSSLVPKSAFPTDAVYGTVPTPQLRLITCDGPFDRSTGHYTENLVVFATLTQSNP
ncbi:sortase domain-bontaining protein [Lacisediminihabitans sp. H27-G8]|uniref:sortase domain-containing protein n=1 Tax=Lacisediminihabitans sp. H27-G8 TaxID=3111909 RepID=UPI0038FD019C